MSDEPKKTPTEQLTAALETVIDQKMAYWIERQNKLAQSVSRLEAKVQPNPIRCPSTNGYHQCQLEVDHPGDHRGINGIEEWYAWERRR